MLNSSSLERLKDSKNLLAFSAGGDSTALLFLLLENNISFDIAIVDYGLRLQSKKEVSYAKELALKYNFSCHVHTAKAIDSNFEAKAREIRYDFFQDLIQEHNYSNLLTAHHLGDRFEWMLMQFCKGAGCVELSGMQEFEKRDTYNLIRPFLHLTKEELLSYLNAQNIKYFEDESNSDEQYKRNYFRVKHTTPLLKKYASGIQKSFEYLDKDIDELITEINVNEIEDFAYFATSHSKRSDILAIDKYFKSRGLLISANEKKLLQEEQTVVISRKFVVNQEHNFVFIMPYLTQKNMSKKFKEQMRLLKIEPKLRAYIYTNENVQRVITSLLS